MKKLLVILFVMTAVSGWCVGSSTQTLADVSNYPKFYATVLAGQTTNASGWKVATYTTILSDTHSGFDGQATYTVQISGWYEMVAKITIYLGASGDVGVRLSVDGTPKENQFATTPAANIDTPTTHHLIAYLPSGSLVSPQFYCASSGATRNYGGYFIVRRIP